MQWADEEHNCAASSMLGRPGTPHLTAIAVKLACSDCTQAVELFNSEILLMFELSNINYLSINFFCWFPRL